MKKSLLFLIAAIIMLPGVYIQGELINFLDILAPIFFALSCFKNRNINIAKRLVPLTIYVLICFASIVFACINDGMFYGTAFLKWFRILEILFVANYVSNMSDDICIKKDEVISFILNTGIISGLIGIILFLTQSSLYRAPQRFMFNNQLFYRGGGVFAEAITFSFMMVCIFAVALQAFLNRMYTFKSLSAIIISVICIIISDTRSTLLSLAAIFIYTLISNNILNKQRIPALSAIALIVIIVALNKSNYLEDFWERRVIYSFNLISELDYKSLNAASSGRLDLWKYRLEEYSELSFIQKCFGRGYKCYEDFLGADNQFLSSLYFTGIFGFVSFIFYYIGIIRLSLKHGDKVLMNIFRCCVIAMSFSMLFTDGMSMYRPMCLIMLIEEIYFKANKYKKYGRCAKIEGFIY